MFGACPESNKKAKGVRFFGIRFISCVGGIYKNRFIFNLNTKIYFLQKALSFHHTSFKSRKINVELTAGGGGNNENRVKKLQDKRKNLERERSSVN